MDVFSVHMPPSKLYTAEEIRDKIASHQYNAELMLKHLMLQYNNLDARLASVEQERDELAEEIDGGSFYCPECQSQDVEEIGYEDDFGSMACNACGYQGAPGEDFPATKGLREERDQFQGEVKQWERTALNLLNRAETAEKERDDLRAQLEREKGEREGLTTTLRQYKEQSLRDEEVKQYWHKRAEQAESSLAAALEEVERLKEKAGVAQAMQIVEQKLGEHKVNNLTKEHATDMQVKDATWAFFCAEYQQELAETKAQLAAAQSSAKGEYRRGMERAAEIAEGLHGWPSPGSVARSIRAEANQPAQGGMMGKEFEPGLVSSDIRYTRIKHTGMIQNNSGGWVSAQNYRNLSRQLDRAVQQVADLSAVNAKMREALEKTAHEYDPKVSREIAIEAIGKAIEAEVISKALSPSGEGEGGKGE